MASTKNRRYEMDMCNGPILGKILLFSFPVMLSGILQLLFNAADIIVVGRFAGETALAAVGSTSALINLYINIFIGLSVGTNVMVSRYYGSAQTKELNEMIHTSILTALISGIVLVFLGITFARTTLIWMDTPSDVIDQSTLYMKIYFLGMPAMMLYNFGSAILRAVGDTRRPLYYLTFSGVINVMLNLIFVCVFHMGVAGVAAATTISQMISAALVIRCLIKSEGPLHLELHKLCIKKDKLLKMVQIGVPAGLQGALFSISNVLIQSSINSFGSIAMAGNTAAANLEGFVYVAMNSFYQTAISFVGQNFGAMKMKRIARITRTCLGCVTIVGLIMGIGTAVLAPVFLRLYSNDTIVIEYGRLRLMYISIPYALCGMMDVMVGVIRGMGYSILPMMVSLAGACLFRVVWIATVFEHYKTLISLYISYPISWTLTFIAHLICFIVIYKKNYKKYGTV